MDPTQHNRREQDQESDLINYNQQAALINLVLSKPYPKRLFAGSYKY